MKPLDRIIKALENAREDEPEQQAHVFRIAAAQLTEQAKQIELEVGE